jgi:hypothetical protein
VPRGIRRVTHSCNQISDERREGKCNYAFSDEHHFRFFLRIASLLDSRIFAACKARLRYRGYRDTKEKGLMVTEEDAITVNEAPEFKAIGATP